MMSRTQLSSTILAMSLVLPWNIADAAPAEPAPGATVRGAAQHDRVAGQPSRAAGARTRSEGLGVRDASTQPRAARPGEGLLVVRPMTPVQETAAILMRTPPGRRAVHIAGFAGDITAYGDARAAGAAVPVQVSADADIDSGIQRGIERVRDRVLHRMRALRAAGVRIDSFTVEHPASLPQGPFADMVLAEAVDSAVLEVFPQAKGPQRIDEDGGSQDVADAGEGDDDPEAIADAGAGEGTDAPPPASPPTRGSGAAAAARSAASPQRAEVPHWEAAMEERGIQWDRIMADTQQGVMLTSARRSR